MIALKQQEFPSNTSNHSGLNIAHTAVSIGWPVPKPVRIWKFSYGLRWRVFPLMHTLSDHLFLTGQKFRTRATEDVFLSFIINAGEAKFFLQYVAMEFFVLKPQSTLRQRVAWQGHHLKFY